MKIALVVALGMLGGCLWANPNSYMRTGIDLQGVAVGERGTHGANARALADGAGVGVAVEVGERAVSRTGVGDPNDYTGASIDFLLRVSLPGVMPTDHRLDRFFDFGVEGGGGGVVAFGVPPGVQGMGDAFIGGWVELGTVPVSGNHGWIAITGSARSYGLDSGWDNQTVYTVAIGWRSREKLTQHDAGSWHD